MLSRYYNWLHGRWPAGRVEKLPVVGEDGVTNQKGIRIVGDLSGIPLLKFSSDTGARAIHAILKEPDFSGSRNASDGIFDVAIIGAGVSGISAAMEAAKAGLSYKIYEASRPFSTVANFPKGKPIYTYPTDMTPAGGIQYEGDVGVKESLLEDMEKQRTAAGVETEQVRIETVKRSGNHFELARDDKTTDKARRVIVAIGRSGNFRKIGIPGEDHDKVSNRLHDPKEFGGKNVLVVGGGDSACEAAIALTACGANVTFVYRGKELSRPKPENVAKLHQLAQTPGMEVQVAAPTSERVTTAAHSSMRGDKPAGTLGLALGTSPTAVTATTATLKEGKDGPTREIPNDYVFAMIGREAPLDFFRRSGIDILGNRTPKFWWSFAAICVFTIWLYLWKNYLIPAGLVNPKGWIEGLITVIGGAAETKGTLLHTILESAKARGFYYGLAYCLLVAIFGYRRVKRRKTPYVKLQTISLVAVQWIPLFILPEIILPWMGANGWFDSGFGLTLAENFFSDGAGNNTDYWRSYGFILAWPLFVANWFTPAPLWGWLIVGFIQTFVIIPWIVRRWGKGAYCGWICSCGALAETLGDAHRHKMPHGPKVNRLNMVGQAFLWIAAALMIVRIVSWLVPGTPMDKIFTIGKVFYWGFVDILWAGVIGIACYFHFSGRVWCRFACPLAALMHIYARFTKFRIFPEKSKCISCNVCTSVCHQGIDIMNFANKGLPMQDPECVRCSACVQQCPTGVLQFGREAADGKIIFDTLAASPVIMAEKAKR